MENKEIKKRGWVKNAAIIFLVLMLALTFFSNTIMNWSLPEVSGQYTTRGSITTSVRGTGKVTANVAYNVSISEGREIEEVHVKKGDIVEAGDLLFTLTDKDSSEVERAVEQLENLLYNYEVKMLNSTIADDIASLKEQIAEAEKELSEHDGYQSVYDTEKAAYDEIAERMAVINEQQLELSEKLSELQRNEAGGYENIAEKLAEVDELSEKLGEARDAFGELSETSAEVKDAERTVELAEAALEAAEDALEDAQDLWIESEERYEEALDRRDAYQRADVAYRDAEDYLAGLPDGAPEYASARRTADELKARRDLISYPTDAELKNLEKAIETNEETYDKAFEARSKAGTALEDAKKALEKVKAANIATNVSQEEYEAAEDLVKSLEKSKAAAEKNLASLVKTATNEVKALQKENVELKKTVQKELDEAQTKLDDAAKDASSGVTEDTLKNLKQQLQSRQKSEKLFQMEVERDLKEINKQRAQINELRAGGISGEVVAKYAGTISSVNVMAGDTVERDQTMCQIEVNGKGYTVSISVTNEQASMVKVGDEATVNNYFWGNIYVKLAAIKADRTNPGSKKLLEFDVEGDVTDGQSLELTIGKKTSNYANVVPNSAIREDSEGTFILAAVAKSTPLGNRYTATRMAVTVLESDDYSSAIDTGTAYGYDYIIVSSSKPVEAGMLVRLVEGS